MSKPYRDFEPKWYHGEVPPTSYRSIFKWGAPDQIKPPKESLYKLVKEKFGLTDADFDHYTENLGLDAVRFDLPCTMEQRRLDAFRDIVGAEYVRTDDYARLSVAYGKTMYDICKGILPKAKAVVSMGTCACYGGVQAAKPNPTAAKGVNDAFGDLGVKAINIAGCPPNPLNLVGTLVAFLKGQKIELDENGRPLMFYGQSVHDLCERRKHFDAGEFAPSFNSEEARKGWCLYEVGCKGPQTYNNCPKVLFNQTNWPVGAGHPCIGCSEPGFWDEMTPFYQN